MSLDTGFPGPVEILQELIRRDTTNPPGREFECVEYVESLLERVGVESERLASDPRRPNLWARLPGTGEAPPLMLYGHCDVVPADGERWTHPPFDAVRSDGMIWGRGALDMKGGLAMMIAAFLRAACDARPAGDLILLVLADEEASSELGARYVVEEHPSRFEDVQYAIGELGGFPLHVGDSRYYTVQVTEKRLCWLEATVTGAAGGHGALPGDGTAVGRLGEVLSTVARGRLPVRITGPVRRMIRAMIRGADDRAARSLGELLDPSTAARGLEELSELSEHRSLFEALLRDTVNPTVVRAGKSINVVPDRGVVRMDGRLLPGGEADRLTRSLDEMLPPNVREGVRYRVLRNPSGQGEPDLGLFPLLRDLLLDADPGGTPIPFVLPAVTDAHYFASLGIQTYGFLPLDLPRGFDLLDRIHAPDERVPVRSIRFGTRILRRLLRRYGRGDA